MAVSTTPYTNGTTPPKVNSRMRFKQIGLTGLDRQGGWIYEEFLPELKGYRWINIIKEIETQDAVCGAALFAINTLISQVPMQVVPLDENNQEDSMAAEFITTALNDMSNTWLDVLDEIMTMFPYGWSYMEWTLKRRTEKTSKFPDGKIGWLNWAIRSQDSLWEWKFAPNGHILGMYQQPPPDYDLRYIPMEKALLFRTTTRKGNPEGFSILRRMYRAWYFAKHIENIEGIAIERELTGLPVMKVPAEYMMSDATQEQADLFENAKEIVTGVRMDSQGGLVIPQAYDKNGNSLFEFELVTAAGSRTMDTDKPIRRYNQQKLMTILADFILVGHSNVGSFALSENKTGLFSLAMSSYLQKIDNVINDHAIPKLLSFNGMRGKCKMVHGKVEDVSLKDLGEYISKLAGVGFDLTQIDGLQNHLLQIANLPINK